MKKKWIIAASLAVLALALVAMHYVWSEARTQASLNAQAYQQQSENLSTHAG